MNKNQTQKGFENAMNQIDLEAIKQEAIAEAKKLIEQETEAKEKIRLEALRKETEEEEKRLAGLTKAQITKELKEKQKKETEALLKKQEEAKKIHNNSVSEKPQKFGQCSSVFEAIKSLNYSFSTEENCKALLEQAIKEYKSRNKEGSRHYLSYLVPRIVQVMVFLDFAKIENKIVTVTKVEKPKEEKPSEEKPSEEKKA